VSINKRFTIPAFAKINWELRVLGRRPDNLHELQTIFQTVTLCDHLTFSRSDDESISLHCDTTALDIPMDHTNLVHRAALILKEEYSVRIGAHIKLDKHIPSAAGLGGGSSDAAVALIGLARLWEINIDKDKLCELGARLGADVPFFFYGGTALGFGTGTEIVPIDDASHTHLLIVTPNVRINTVEAYKSLNAPALTKVEEDIMLRVSRAEAKIKGSLLDVLYNDFEAEILSKNPEIERVRDKLLKLGAGSAMLAGSGSSFFGLFDNIEIRDFAMNTIRSSEAGWRVFACEPLKRAQYKEALGQCALLL
jgi:4-diphosphocytidyl-2-C-methyl-D-erythritol kinase